MFYQKEHLKSNFSPIDKDHCGHRRKLSMRTPEEITTTKTTPLSQAVCRVTLKLSMDLINTNLLAGKKARCIVIYNFYLKCVAFYMFLHFWECKSQINSTADASNIFSEETRASHFKPKQLRFEFFVV